MRRAIDDGHERVHWARVQVSSITRATWLALALGLVSCGGTERAAPSPQVSPRSVEEPEVEPTRVEANPTRPGADLVGRPAPAWGPLAWLGSEPLTLDDLRGRVVLIRFWTDTCPFCRATAPALRQLDADYRERGVTVIGMYHPKPRGAERGRERVAEVIEEWGWAFPVALDTSWAVLDAFWPPTSGRGYTSVSFVLDRRGVIRHVHPGPEFHPGGPADHERCRRDYAEIRGVLDELLAEPEPEPEPEPR